MEILIHTSIGTISMKLPIVSFKGPQVEFLNYDVFLPLKVILIFANSADLDEMQHNAAFHLGFHSSPIYRSLFFLSTSLFLPR